MSEYQYTGKCSVCLIYGCASCRTHTYIIARCKNFLQCRTIIFPCEINFKIISAKAFHTEQILLKDLKKVFRSSFSHHSLIHKLYQFFFLINWTHFNLLWHKKTNHVSLINVLTFEKRQSSFKTTIHPSLQLLFLSAIFILLNRFCMIYSASPTM
jgi:hypothetical protein